MSQKWLTMYDVFNDPAPVSTCCGDTMRTEYALSVGKDGRKCLKPVRDVDISAYINSFAPGCDMAVIINKLSAGLIPTGYDESNCVDLSLMPKGIVDAMQSVRQFRDQFSEFPVEVQKLFDYNPDLFVQSFVNGDLEDALKTLQSSEPPKEQPKEQSKEQPKEQPKEE